MNSGPKKYNKKNYSKRTDNRIRKNNNQWVKSIGNNQRIIENDQNPIRVLNINAEKFPEYEEDVMMRKYYRKARQNEYNEKTKQVENDHLIQRINDHIKNKDSSLTRIIPMDGMILVVCGYGDSDRLKLFCEENGLHCKQGF